MKWFVSAIVIGFALVQNAEAGCSSIRDSYKRRQCQAYTALAASLNQPYWTVCNTEADGETNPCGNLACVSPNNEALMKCDGSGRWTGVRILSEINATIVDEQAFNDAVALISNLATFNMMRIENNTGLGLTSCYAECETNFGCLFTGSDCSGLCTEDGICTGATAPPTEGEAPTDPPTTEEPTPTDPPTAEEPTPTDPPTAEEPTPTDPPTGDEPTPTDPPTAEEPAPTDPPTTEAVFGTEKPTVGPEDDGASAASSTVTAIFLVTLSAFALQL